MLSREEYIKKQIKNYYIRDIKEEKIINNCLKEARKKENIKKYYHKKLIEPKQIIYYKEKRRDDIMIRILDNLSNRIRRELNAIGKERNGTYIDLLGCSLIEFQKHLSDLFTEGMNFDNYPEWKIDHIIPISSFNLSDDKQLRKCCHYTNLQPLWLPQNRSKGAKIL